MSETHTIPHPDINNTTKPNWYHENKTKGYTEKRKTSGKDSQTPNSGDLWVVELGVNYYFFPPCSLFSTNEHACLL